MTRNPTSVGLHRRLLAAARAEGINCRAVAAAICHGDTVLLLAQGGDGFLNTTWELPTARVLLPGDTLPGVLHRSVAHAGLAIDRVTGYLGHQDRDHIDGTLMRVFGFSVTVTNPASMRRSPLFGHVWSRSDQLPDTTTPTSRHFARLATGAPAAQAESPPSLLVAGLRAHALGLHPAEAAAELLIHHAFWLRRNDFTTGFVHHDHEPSEDVDIAAIDWPAAITALDAGELPCSGGEARILRLAASLAHGTPVDLRDALTGLDAHNADLICQAVLHTNGRRPTRNPQ